MEKVKKELSKEEQIEVLEHVVEKLKKNNYFQVYICSNILSYLFIKKNIFFKTCSSINITPYIPIFSRSNATIACKEMGIRPPYKDANGGWWKYNDVNTRIKVLEWMINKIKTIK